MEPNNQNTPPQVQGVHCNLCGKKAESLCGRCFDVGYCKPQHQKADWPAHRTKCISIGQKIKIHNKQKYKMRAEIMDFVGDMRFYEASQVANTLMQQQKKFSQNHPTFSNQIQYGASVVLLTRIWIYFKDFNKALDVLNNYTQTKLGFLKSVQNVQKLYQDGGIAQKQRNQLIQKKLNLISAVASVSHQLVRNAIDIFQILVNHIQAIYGPNSLQLSNIYFYCGNYLNFLNQPNKAVACFLKAAKIRGNKCSTSYYNAGIVFLQQKNYSLALDTLLLALNNLTQAQRAAHPQLEINIYEALGATYKNLNIYHKSVMSFQRALCLRQKRKNESPENKSKYRNLQTILNTMKLQSQKIQSQIRLYSLPKQKPKMDRNIELSSFHFKNVIQVDKIPTQQQENQDWVQSFNQFKKRLNVISKINQVPPVAASKLFGKDKQQVIRQQQVPNSVAKSKDKLIQQKINVSLQLIQRFTSTQMDFLNQLNRLISQCKQKSAIIDIFQNSNLYQTISRQKLDMLYRLNPKLYRNNRQASSRNIQLTNSVDQNQNFSRQYGIDDNKTAPKKTKLKTPRLNLSNLPKNF